MVTHIRTPNRTAVAALALLLAGCAGDGNNRIEASGTIEGTDVDIGTEVAGRILEVRVREGDRVQPGDTLVQIDDADLLLQLRQADAATVAAEAQYRLAVKGARKEDLLQAEAIFRVAEADFRRMEDLLGSRTVTQKQYDDVRARYVSAQQTYEKLIHGLLPEEITTARARRDQAAAQAELLRNRVNDCRILSPADGTITLRAVEPGELVSPNMNLLRLTALDRVRLTLYLPEAEAGRVQLGQEAAVSIDAFPDSSFPGRVVYVSPKAEFTPKNVQTKEERTKLVFAVRLEVENPDGYLKPGLPADAVIPVSAE
jgi:HlyD family secretion protein